MSLTRAEKRFSLIETIIGIIVVIVGAAASDGAASNRMSEAERRISTVEIQQKTDHDVLIEIRDDVKYLRRVK